MYSITDLRYFRLVSTGTYYLVPSEYRQLFLKKKSPATAAKVCECASELPVRRAISKCSCIRRNRDLRTKIMKFELHMGSEREPAKSFCVALKVEMSEYQGSVHLYVLNLNCI